VIKKWYYWCEWHAAVPEFSGGLLLFLSLFLFAAATNTLAGWLYVISGVSIALLIIGAVFPARFLAEIEVQRDPPEPVSAGSDLYLSLHLRNRGSTTKHLLEVRDSLPTALSPITQQEIIIPSLPPHAEYHWHYQIPTQKRGIYQLSPLAIATASPFGLFRSRRHCGQTHPKLIIYPLVLQLAQCPLLEAMGKQQQTRHYSPRHSQQMATEGLTRTLRPYQWGDPMRMIHWRTSARYGALRVRELETTIGGQEIAITLDLSPQWQSDHFEQAIMVAATLYFHARQLQLQTHFYSQTTGLVNGDLPVLEALASLQPEEDAFQPPDLPILLLSDRPQLLDQLHEGDKYILWQYTPPASQHQGIALEPPSGTPDQKEVQQFWQTQLQAP
jgi:uncharacterized protein (DUF58 family)